MKQRARWVVHSQIAVPGLDRQRTTGHIDCAATALGILKLDAAARAQGHIGGRANLIDLGVGDRVSGGTSECGYGPSHIAYQDLAVGKLTVPACQCLMLDQDHLGIQQQTPVAPAPRPHVGRAAEIQRVLARGLTKPAVAALLAALAADVSGECGLVIRPDNRLATITGQAGIHRK